MTGRIAVGMVAVLLLVYLALAAGRAVILIQSGGAVEILFVVGLLILPIVGLWVLVHELRFGLLSGRLMRLLDEAGELSVYLRVRGGRQSELPRMRIFRSSRVRRMPPRTIGDFVLCWDSRTGGVVVCAYLSPATWLALSILQAVFYSLAAAFIALEYR